MFVDQRTLNDLASELREALADLAVPATVEVGEVRADGPGELLVTVDGRTITTAVTARADLRPAQAKELPAVRAPDDAAPDPRRGSGQPGGGRRRPGHRRRAQLPDRPGGW